ncbi:hypothetical protein BAUCODRAFT_148901 [Baudoinia panamericana UAMH 10762]|uniref:FAD-binding domain-containing protein n=1 Tax=Baudoinia panamericana (strain UAMH 10762) TaxID=717646 RepID=M2LNW8_BAUPA|nr:uncharacterized protein BAUCODRAFT_148901 [Baudoinia panamericana UAMH 10762]EMC96067.1 hypothetical protein BAUCODRAFT_148901 [Baudoinia panamericana UAMH 10762]
MAKDPHVARTSSIPIDADNSSNGRTPINGHRHVGELTVPVLIVGAGPVGLLLAKLLTSLDVQCTIIERYASRLAAPKAHALSPRSLEICRQNNLDTHTLRNVGTARRDGYWVNFVATLTGERIGQLPYERMDAEVLHDTPEMIHNVPQPVFETFVQKSISDKVEILRNTSFVSCEERKGLVATTFEDRTTGNLHEITSTYVVACDGAKSKVRSFLGIKCEGEDSYETMMTIHFGADLRPVLGDHVGMLHWIADPAVSGFIIGYDLAGEEVLICNVNTDKHPVATWTADFARSIVTTAIGHDTPFELRSVRPWVLSRKVANQYRKGRVFLQVRYFLRKRSQLTDASAGDAAHAFPPTGGLGLNSGLADAHNLAYKLAAVLQGYAEDSLLDTYESDRRHVAVVNAQQSVKNGKQIFGLLRALGTTTDDTAQARANLHDALAEPVRRAHIDEEVRLQQEHFDNLELHIGYVYGSSNVPPHASQFTAKYVPGARLPHVWIWPSASLYGSLPPPANLAYIEELDADRRRGMQYSSLDLCAYDAFTIIASSSDDCRAAIRSAVQQLRARNVPVRAIWYDEDFTVVPGTHGQIWLATLQLSSGGAVIVRPDQHILSLLQPISSAQDIVEDILSHVGREACA